MTTNQPLLDVASDRDETNEYNVRIMYSMYENMPYYFYTQPQYGVVVENGIHKKLGSNQKVAWIHKL